MKMYSRVYFIGFLVLILLSNTACGKKSDLTLPEEPTKQPTEEQAEKPTENIENIK